MTKEAYAVLAEHKDELQRIADFLGQLLDKIQDKPVDSNHDTLRERTAKLLQEMNMPRNLDGFQMIVDAVVLLDQNPRMSFDQVLYPKLAGETKNKSQIERVIRYAISYVLSQPEADRVVKLLGYSNVNEISTNRKFLLALLHVVR